MSWNLGVNDCSKNLQYTPYTPKVGAGFGISVWSRKNNYTLYAIQLGVLGIIWI